MCLLVMAWRAHPHYRLIVAANRDEFHARPTAPMSVWPDAPGILAGRDLSAQGTWLAVDRSRRFGIITNFRDVQARRPEAPSRGGLIPDWLSHTDTPAAFLGRVEAQAQSYAGFNLLLNDADSLWYASNRAPRFSTALAPGSVWATVYPAADCSIHRCRVPVPSKTAVPGWRRTTDCPHRSAAG